MSSATVLCLYYHVSDLPFSSILHPMLHFKSNNTIVCNNPIRHKHTLGVRNNIRQYRFHTVRKNLRDNPRNHITVADGTKFCDILWIILFGN